MLREVGEDLEIVEVLRPSLQSGQVLVQLTYSGVCRSQLMEVRGLRGPDPWLPHLLGHEGVGVVMDVASDVSKVKVGDRVVIGWMVGSGIEAPAPTLTSITGDIVNSGRVTTFSEWTVVSENRVYHVPAQIENRTAVLFGCALLTGSGMVLREAALEVGNTVLINGVGGIGLAALIAALGLDVEVVVAEPDSTKRDLAVGMGAALAFNPLSASGVQRFRDHFSEGVDVAIDASGSIAGIESAFSMIKFNGGTLLFASHPPSGELLRIDPHDLIRGKRIRGSWGGGSRPDADIAVLASSISDRNLDLGFMTPRIYRLEEVNEALVDLEKGRAVRPLLQM